MLNEDEAQFLEMDTQWCAAVSRVQVERSALSAWEDHFSDMCSEHDELLQNGRWVAGSDDLLTIIRRARHEAYHSALLAWLLNPVGKHGLGISLLKSLLAHAGVNQVPDLHLARPALEVQRADTRADIVVFAPGCTIVLENKVNAGEQPRQCDRLVERFGADPGAVFIFLTPTGRAPLTATGLALTLWHTIGYETLFSMLTEALRTVAAPASLAGRATAENYLATLRREFT